MDLKFIFFDFGGTIDSDGICWRDRFYNIYLENGIKISYEEFSKAFFDSDDNLPKRYNLSGKGFEETVYLQVNDVLKYLNLENENLRKKIADKFIYDSKKKVCENIPLFKYLKNKNITLGIISNFYGNLNDVLESLYIRDFFEVVADSGVIGSIKPSITIFNYALEKVNADIKSSAMVGDAYHRDIIGAHNVGMYHFYISKEERNKCCEKFFLIKNIRELIKYV